MQNKKRKEIRTNLENPTQSNEAKHKVFSYGVIDFYMNYADMKNDKQSWVHTPHSIWTGCSDDMFYETEMASLSYSTMLVYNQWDKQEYLRLTKGKKSIEIVSHPFYIIQNLYGKTQKEKKSGTVFFYPHGLGADCPPAIYSAKLINYLTLLEKKSEPLYVCFHFNDYKLFDLSILRDVGIIPVSAGDPKDPEFMLNLYIILDEAKKTISVDYGTQVFLSLITECETILERNLTVLNFIPPEYYPNYGFTLPFPHYRKFYKMMINKNEKHTETLVAYAHELLGKDAVLSSKQMNELFLNAKKEAFSFIKNKRLVVPTFCIRYFIKPIELKIKAVRIKLGLKLLNRKNYYVNSSFLIDIVIAHHDSQNLNHKNTHQR
jgi:hypothetical protein